MFITKKNNTHEDYDHKLFNVHRLTCAQSEIKWISRVCRGGIPTSPSGQGRLVGVCNK